MKEKIQKRLPIIMLALLTVFSFFSLYIQHYGDPAFAKSLLRIQFVLVLLIAVIASYILFRRYQQKKKDS